VELFTQQQPKSSIKMKFDIIDTDQKFSDWQQFAREFDHDSESPILPLVTFSDDRGMFGYYSTLNSPIIFPAFHPDKTSARSFKEVIDCVSNMHCLTSVSQRYPNGVSWAAIHEASPIIDKAERVGYEDTGYKLFRRIP
jgi:hypothetical protein